jgi:hypothetical protein
MTRWLRPVLLAAPWLLAVAACAPSSARAPSPVVSAPPSQAPARGPTAGAARKCPRIDPAPAAVRPPARPGGACHSLPFALQRELTSSMEREVRGSDAKLDVRVEFQCSPVAEVPAEILALHVSGHGGSTRVVQLQRLPDYRFALRILRAHPDEIDASAAADAAPGASSVEFARATLAERPLLAAFERMSAALAARVSTQRESPPSGQVALAPIETSDNKFLIELRLRDRTGGEIRAFWDGHVDNERAAERVPVQFAWQALAVLLPEATVNTAEAADRALLREVWSEHASRSWYAEQGLLALASEAGSPELIPYLVSALDSELPRTQELSVAALAAITGWDARRDATGSPRPLPEVVADYRRECAAP